MRRLLRRWWVRWIVLPLAALFAVHAGWTLVLKWRLERRIEELRASGAPVDLRDLARPRVADEENAAALFAEANAWYDRHLRPEPARLGYGDDLCTDEDRSEIAEWLARGDAYADLLARAAAKPALWQPLDWEAGPSMVVTALPQTQTAAIFLENRVRFAERATPQAARELAVLLDWSSKLERRPLLLVLVRWTVDGVAANTLEVLAGKPGFDAREARALLDERFAAADDPSLLRDALLGERAFALSMSRKWSDGESPRRVLLGDDGTGLLNALSESWLGRPLVYQDALRLLDLMEGMLPLADLPPREALPAADALPKSRRVTYFVSGLIAPVAAKAIRTRMRHQATMRIARVGLALLQLRQETGAWPETLDAVVPLVGAEWVEDPFTGTRLQYEPGVRVEAAVPIPDEEQRADFEIVWRFGP